MPVSAPTHELQFGDAKIMKDWFRLRIFPVFILCAAVFIGRDACAIERAEALKTLESLESAFVYLAEQVRPAVVSLSPYVPPLISQKLSSYERSRPNNSASGVIIDGEKGYIVTNSHAVRDVDGVEVKLLTGEKLIGTVVGHDDDTDLAVVQIESKSRLPSAAFGDSSKIKVGQVVVAVGNPYGLSDTLTSGIISGLNRENINLSRYEDFIQTDASINPGNSGGPLLNVRGEVIGINTAIINYAQNIGFAIPSNIVKSIVAQLIQHGEVKRGWLGVGLESVAKSNSSKSDANAGVLVNSVYEGEPAHRAGIREGDHVLKVGGAPVNSANEMIRMIGSVYPGQKITLDILRDGRSQSVTVELSSRKEKEALGIPVKLAPILGFQVKDIDDGTANERDKKGVVVFDVLGDSLAHQSGLLKGDLIYNMNGEAILNKEWFEKSIKKAHKGKAISLRVYRGEESLDLILPLSN